MTEQQMKGIARLCDFDYSHPRTKILMDTVAAKAREEQDREIAELRTWYDKGMEVANGFLDKPSESHIVDRICIIGWERDELRAKVKEQDREIAELRARLPGTDAPWTLKELDDARERIAEQDREIERLQLLRENYYKANMEWSGLAGRKAADVEIWKNRAEKAEAKVKEFKELMQEAVFDDWFCQNEPDFMERWNKALAEKEKV